MEIRHESTFDGRVRVGYYDSAPQKMVRELGQTLASLHHDARFEVSIQSSARFDGYDVTVHLPEQEFRDDAEKSLSGFVFGLDIAGWQNCGPADAVNQPYTYEFVAPESVENLQGFGDRGW